LRYFVNPKPCRILNSSFTIQVRKNGWIPHNDNYSDKINVLLLTSFVVLLVLFVFRKLTRDKNEVL